MTNSNKMVAATFIAAVLMALTGVKAWAQLDNDDFTLDLTIGNALAVNVETPAGVDLTNYDFTPSVNLTFGDITVNETSIRIDNESGSGAGGLLQTYSLSIEDTVGGLALQEGATLGASDEYRVSALFQDAQPAQSDFDLSGAATDDILTTAAKVAEAHDGGARRFVKTGGSVATDQDGFESDDDNRGAGSSAIGEINLWLQLELSAAGTQTGLQAAFATVFISAS